MYCGCPGTSLYPQQFSVTITYTAAVPCHTQQLYYVTAALCIEQQQHYALCHSSSLQHCRPVLTAYRVVLAIDADCVLVLHCRSALYVMHASLCTAVKAR